MFLQLRGGKTPGRTITGRYQRKRGSRIPYRSVATWRHCCSESRTAPDTRPGFTQFNQFVVFLHNLMCENPLEGFLAVNSGGGFKAWTIAPLKGPMQPTLDARVAAT